MNPTAKNLAKSIYSLIDLTSLNLTDTENDIAQLCQQATSSLGHVAAVCIYTKFISLAKQLLKDPAIKIATVANFPQGDQPIQIVSKEIETAIKLGAQEIDVVMPYHAFLAKKYDVAKNFVRTCKDICGPQILLKIILETGVLQETDIIARASQDVILAGADFIKTSTGKTAVSATLEAAEIMLTTIHNLKLNRIVGCKVSGGIRTLRQAKDYLELAEKNMGKDWISPKTFRIGASSLVKEILQNN